MKTSEQTAYYMNEGIRLLLLGSGLFLGASGFIEIARSVEYIPLTPVQKIIAGISCIVAFRIVSNKEMVKPDKENKE